MSKRKLAIAGVLLCSLAWGQSSTDVVATGLQGPNRVRITPRGNLMVSENGTAANAGRISIVTTSGARRSLLEGLPAGADVEGNVSGPADMAWMGRTLWVLIGAGDAEVAGATQGTYTLNPKGTSSPILSSLLSFEFSADIDEIQTPFRLERAQHQAIWDGETVELRNEQGQRAEVQLVTDIRDLAPDPVSIYRASNPYSLAIRGPEAWIADASMDLIFRVDLRTGRTRVAKRFGKVPNPIPVGPPVTDTVPNKVLPFGDNILISEMTGFPFGANNGRIEILDPRTGNTQPFLYNLTMPIDIAFEERGQGQRTRFYTLEFSTAFLRQPPAPGRLKVYDSPEGQVLKADLVTPTSMALARGGEIYITELATGRLLRVRVSQ